MEREIIRATEPMPSEPSQKLTLGRLQKVDLRTYWCEADAEFTSWLAQADNIKLLGEAIGRELTVFHAQASSADMLCRDAGDRWVLIENQLEPTDHHHLGRLLTAMADLQATPLQSASVVWIASSFTREHQTVLNWLNQITAPEWQFFGLEIELWRIGESVAPRFNLVVQPEGEAIAPPEVLAELGLEARPEAIQEVRPEVSAAPAALTEAQQQNLDFWRELCHQLERRGSIVKSSQPSTENHLSFAIGRAGFRLYTRLDEANELNEDQSDGDEADLSEPDQTEPDQTEPDQTLIVGLLLSGEDAKPHFYLLQEDREAIESEIGISLEWDAGEDRSCLIYCLLAGVDLGDRDQWMDYYQWFCVYLEQFHEVFGDRIKRLNANDYHPLPDYSFNPLKSASLPGS